MCNCLSMRVSTCTRMHACTHTHRQTHRHTYTKIESHTHERKHTHAQHTHTQTNTNTNTHKHSRTHTKMPTHTYTLQLWPGHCRYGLPKTSCLFYRNSEICRFLLQKRPNNFWSLQFVAPLHSCTVGVRALNCNISFAKKTCSACFSKWTLIGLATEGRFP